jgi:pilus assembly protein CpaF
VSIRKFAKRALDLDTLIKNGALSATMARVLGEAVRTRVSIVISGGTGSGKTTFLNALSRFISGRERLITIEDAAELQLQQPHVGRLETRPPNMEGRGEIRQRELVKNALRMRPDRIIVGEVRGEEAFDMLQAMTTGHEGSMTTVHANSPRDAISRLEQMVGMAGFAMTEASIRSQIASAIKIIVQLQRFADGKRRVTSVSEVTGLDGTVIQMQEIFKFMRNPQGGGEYRATGLRPTFVETLVQNGVELPQHTFHPGVPQ